ncbi:MAG: isoaspartyl peptidase/L-asparaginase [Thermoplasmata archaeon]
MLIAAHGGVGKDSNREYLEKALKKGFNLLKKGGSSTDAVVEVVAALEDDPHFNAGYGSNMKVDGSIEMDAAVANSMGLYAGVAAIQHVQNPVKVALEVAKKTPHVLLVGSGAMQFARKNNFPVVDLYTIEAQKRMEAAISKAKRDEKYNYLRDFLDTVGCVAVDDNNVYAAATSTGGVSLMLKGRVGDTPLFGCGIYADKKGAIVSTGIGEYIIKHVLAKSIYDKTVLLNINPKKVVEEEIKAFPDDVSVGVLFLYENELYVGNNMPMAWSVMKA